jgi:hypothetical protein
MSQGTNPRKRRERSAVSRIIRCSREFTQLAIKSDSKMEEKLLKMGMNLNTIGSGVRG